MIYNCYDIESGRVVSVFANVASARLTGAVMAIGNAVVTVQNTDNLWPGMWVVGKGIPANTLVLSVDTATTFTMTAVATAVSAAGIIVARGYVSEPVVKSLNIEHYRDIFGANGIVSGVASGVPAIGGGAVSAQAVTPSTGSTMYITNPQAVAVQSGAAGVVGFIAGNLVASQSDEVSHTAPREQVQKVSTVFFICTDGSILPAPIFPNLHFAQDAASE